MSVRKKSKSAPSVIEHTTDAPNATVSNATAADDTASDDTASDVVAPDVVAPETSSVMPKQQVHDSKLPELVALPRTQTSTRSSTRAEPAAEPSNSAPEGRASLRSPREWPPTTGERFNG
jgi:hypothetical protein